LLKKETRGQGDGGTRGWVSYFILLPRNYDKETRGRGTRGWVSYFILLPMNYDKETRGWGDKEMGSVLHFITQELRKGDGS